MSKFVKINIGNTYDAVRGAVQIDVWYTVYAAVDEAVGHAMWKAVYLVMWSDAMETT